MDDAKTAREPKHVMLYTAIARLESAIGDLIDLVDRVEGLDKPAQVASPAEPCAPSNVPALSTILTESSERLLTLTKAVDVSRGRLKDLLF